MENNMKELQHFIDEAEHQDVVHKKREMFGGSKQKEQEFKKSFEAVKEKFKNNIYNISQKKDTDLLKNKLNRFVNLIRKSKDDDQID